MSNFGHFFKFLKNRPNRKIRCCFPTLFFICQQKLVQAELHQSNIFKAFVMTRTYNLQLFYTMSIIHTKFTHILYCYFVHKKAHSLRPAIWKTCKHEDWPVSVKITLHYKWLSLTHMRTTCWLVKRNILSLIEPIRKGVRKYCLMCKFEMHNCQLKKLYHGWLSKWSFPDISQSEIL